MRVLIDLGGQQEVIELADWQPEATVAQLCAAAGILGLEPEEQLFLDGAPVTGATKLQEVVMLEGSVLAREAPSPVQRVHAWNVSISGGVAVSDVVVIPGHRKLVVGRAPQADLVLPTDSASWHHCTLELEPEGVRLRDAGSTNGTVVDGAKIDDEGVLISEAKTVIAGGAVLSIRPKLEESPAPAPGSLANLTPAATAPFNRPPRPGRPAPPDALEPPVQKDVPAASKFSYISILAPLVMAGVLIVVMKDARFAMFAILSPIMGIGMWFEQKRRRAKNLKEEEARFSEALEAFQGEIREIAADESLRRQSSIPDPGLLMRRPTLPSTLLWQRRVAADDFLSLHIGVGDVPWKPEVSMQGVARLDDRVKQVLEESVLPAAPVLGELGNSGVIGIVGDRDGALALARSLIMQAAVHCGPADLTIGLFCDGGRETDWEWAAWLPHTRLAGSSEGARWMSNKREQSASMLRNLLDSIEALPTPTLLTVLDSEVLTEGRDAPARELLGLGRVAPGSRESQDKIVRRVSGIVIATTSDKLPAACTAVIEVGQDAAATVHHPEDLTRVEDVILAGISVESAETSARRLAHFEDPELVVPGASLPSLVRLPELLDARQLDADAIQRMWAAPTGMSTPVGLGESGVLDLDIVKDGPHGLVGGTTGSGKSEFLRSFVAGLAARNDPTRLNFILIDFKGGAAFKACERLPHTIGTISNLDEQLADRALRALEAEMERRQRLFAAAGEDIDNLPAYLATKPAEPLPRLLLVIDEFAMLAKDFPDVLASLVSVAAVGRTLGVHMILATQRPAGVVNEDILANTNLRVALRVQSREDSSNVISVPSAASIGRAQMGRAYVKLGQDDITPVQTALVTGRAKQDLAEVVEVREIGLFGVPMPRKSAISAKASDANDLDLLIDAVVQANELNGYAPPRQVWPEALGEQVNLDGYKSNPENTEVDVAARPTPATGGMHDTTVNVALADEPDLQRQSPAGWNLAEGNLLLLGIAGSGTSTTLASIALSVAATKAPDEVDILCLDVGSRGLASLAGLPHTVAYVGSGPGAKEQQARFLRHLTGELARRRETNGPHRPTIILIDGFAAMRDELQDFEGQQLLDSFYRVYADGPAFGMHFAVTTTRAKSVPSAMDEVTTQRWVFRLADVFDYSNFGVKGKDIPATIAGRCVDATTLLQMHIATAPQGMEVAVQEAKSRWAGAAAKADVIGSLPDNVLASSLVAALDLTGEPLRFPIGVREDTLTAGLVELYEGEHALIAGPARSGKSTLLLALAEVLRSGETKPAVWGIYDRRSPLGSAALDRSASGADEIPALLSALQLETGPVYLLIDDAERVEDADQALQKLAESNHPGLCMIAAGRSADLRSIYSHWTKSLRKSRCGVLLQPDTDFDGELLSVSIPRRAPVAITTGRGYLCVGGSVALVQTMSPSAEGAGL
ncbi:FHA domain-containing protein [Leucobacter viscericola]|uniref:FHA domain-containing protein n=1 Tax=Leucobacter viscericola TaxID=2714935 RepID=A0A6G7XEF7_9MICO|nr:FtsK/SpoIIIE domain-containing protein [Leucobacter viscericola]QIK62945.1 FHA domain-containing protein [Leucobacter viscericola]